MIQVFDKKVIISGTTIEYYEYKSKPVLRGYHRRARKKKERKEGTEQEQLKKMQSSVNRTRTAIRRLVQANPQLTKFLTLTCPMMTDLREANKEFNLFTQRMKDRYSEFQYLAVIEFQKDIDFYGKIKPNGGAVHYHVLCQLRYVPAKEIGLDIWKHGSIDIERPKGSRWGYISKYIQKDMTDRRMFGKKKYFCSQDLTRPTEFIQDNAVYFMESAQKDIFLRSEKTFYNDYSGEVCRKEFLLKEGII